MNGEIKSALKSLENRHSLVDLEEMVNESIKFSPEEPKTVAPSLILGAGGITLSSLHLFTANWICNVEISNFKSRPIFEYIKKRAFSGYRVQITKPFLEGVRIPEEIRLVAVIIDHGFASARFSQMNFVGDNYEVWLKDVIDGIGTNP